MNKIKIGISSIGLHFPSLSMSVKELAKLRHEDPNKYLQGLGCDTMAICPKGFGVAELATEAARRALSRWDGDKNSIGLFIVGTETASDMSRPLSAWVAEKLNLEGAIRSYEVKHACFGGTAGVRQATEWKLAGIHPHKAALVIAVDVALYQPGDSSEATQGAGAVAMIIDKPSIAEILPLSYPWSKPTFDFWRPVNRLFPLVDGKFSLECYKEAAQKCFQAMVGKGDFQKIMDSFTACCFHTPFPKMVKKAFFSVCEQYGWNEEMITEYYTKKVLPTLEWNLLCGNAYTASVWISVACALRGLNKNEKISIFSYGSGCGAELLIAKAGPLAKEADWAKDVEKDLANRHSITADDYEKFRETIEK